MLKISGDSKDTLKRVSLVKEAKDLFPSLKHHEVFTMMMSLRPAELNSFEKSFLRRKKFIYLVSKSEHHQ